MNFLPKVENVSVIVNDTLADYENIDGKLIKIRIPVANSSQTFALFFSEGDHDPELQNLVEEWNVCLSVYAILIRENI